MAAPLRMQIIAALLARLAEIRATNGYLTDSGLYVQYGPISSAPADPLPRCALVAGDVTEEPHEGLDGGSDRRLWPFTVQGRAEADPQDPGALPGEALLADLKRALFRVDDRTLGDLVEDIQRVAGESVAERIDGGRTSQCSVPFLAVYHESYGAP